MKHAAAAALLANFAHAETVCVAPAAFDTVAKGGATVEQYERRERNSSPAKEAVRYLKFDGRAPISVTSAKAASITGLPGAVRHIITISAHSDMSAPQARIAFKFEEHRSKELCLWYNTFYGTWRLQPLKNSPCSCG